MKVLGAFSLAAMAPFARAYHGAASAIGGYEAWAAQLEQQGTGKAAAGCTWPSNEARN